MPNVPVTYTFQPNDSGAYDATGIYYPLSTAVITANGLMTTAAFATFNVPSVYSLVQSLYNPTVTLSYHLLNGDYIVQQSISVNEVDFGDETEQQVIESNKTDPTPIGLQNGALTQYEPLNYALLSVVNDSIASTTFRGAGNGSIDVTNSFKTLNQGLDIGFSFFDTDGDGSATNMTRLSDVKLTVTGFAYTNLPVISGTNSGQSVLDDSKTTPFAPVTLTDPGVPNGYGDLLVITIQDNHLNATDALGTLSLPATGNATLVRGDAGALHPQNLPGTYTLYAPTTADQQAALRSLVFTPATLAYGAAPVNVQFQIQYEAVQGYQGVTTNYNFGLTVQHDPVLDRPMITGTTAYQIMKDKVSIHPFASVSVTDPGNGTADTANIQLVGLFDTPHGDAGQLVNGSGSATLTANGNGSYTLSGAGSAADLAAALQALTFVPTVLSDAAPQGFVGFNLTVAGAAGSTENDNTLVLINHDPNTVPTISGPPTSQLLNDRAATQVLNGIVLSDPDLGQTETITLTLSANGAPTDANGVLSLGAGQNGYSLTKTASGTYTLSGTSGTGIAGLQAALASVTFAPTRYQVTPGVTVTTGLSVQIDDGDIPASLTTVLNTLTTNDVPLLGRMPANVTLDDAHTIAPLSTLTVSDPDRGQTETVTLTLSNGSVATDANGTLALDNGTDFSLSKTGVGTYVLGSTVPGVHASSGPGTVPLQAMLNHITFTPTAHQVAPGSNVKTNLTVQINDGMATASASTTVQTNALNTAPTISGTVANQSTGYNVALHPFSGVRITDPDFGANDTVSIRLSNPDAGTLSGAGLVAAGRGLYFLAPSNPASETASLQALVFTPTARFSTTGATATTGFTIQVGEKGALTTDTATSVVESWAAPRPILLNPGWKIFPQSIDNTATDVFQVSGNNTQITSLGGNLVVTPTSSPTDSQTKVIIGTGVGVTDLITLSGGSNAVTAAALTAGSLVNIALGGTSGRGANTVQLSNRAGTSSVVASGGSNTVKLNGDATNTVSLTGTQGHNSVTIGAAGDGLSGTATVTLAGNGNTVVGGDESFTVSGSTGSSRVTLGNGNDTVSFGDNGNIVQLGMGNNSVTATGRDSAVVINAATISTDTVLIGSNGSLKMTNGIGTLSGAGSDNFTLNNLGATSALNLSGNGSTVALGADSSLLLTLDPAQTRNTIDIHALTGNGQYKGNVEVVNFNAHDTVVLEGLVGFAGTKLNNFAAVQESLISANGKTYLAFDGGGSIRFDGMAASDFKASMFAYTNQHGVA